MTLADLSTGQHARITSIDTSQPGVVRLMVLGLVEGTIVKHLHAAIGGDPLELELMGTALSVRREQARHFEVEPFGPASEIRP
ncbi:MAG: FeoA family protein [Pseudomonadota bacterium]